MADYQGADLRTIMDFAAETAYLAGRLTLGYFGTGVRPEFKADDSPVTVADRLSEEFIRGRIEKRYPTARNRWRGIRGERDGQRERPLVCRSHRRHAFVHARRPTLRRPAGSGDRGPADGRSRIFSGYRRASCGSGGPRVLLDGRPAHVSEVGELGRAYISCSDFGNFEVYGKADAWNRLVRSTYTRVGWSDAYGYLLVATGRLEAMLDPIMNSWDGGPFVPILQEAGGYFGDWHGNPTIHAGEGLATNAALRDEILRLLNGTK